MRRKGWMWCVLLAAGVVGAAAQTAPTGSAKVDRFAALQFLEGTWEAKATGAGGAAVTGRYAFVPELNGTVLARHATTDPACQGPATFDCAHSDLLYVFQDSGSGAFKAIYFDNEGHVIHYGVTVTGATAVEFLSEGPGPQFRLQYELKDGVLGGRFQIQTPGRSEWRSYLEWQGGRAAEK